MYDLTPDVRMLHVCRCVEEVPVVFQVENTKVSVELEEIYEGGAAFFRISTEHHPVER